VQRREVLKWFAAGWGAAALRGFSAQAEAAGKRAWKTAIGLNGFASSSRKYHKTYPIWEVLDFAAQTGFDGVELVGNWPMGGYPRAHESKRIAALRRLYDAFGLQIFSIQTGAGGAFAPDGIQRKQWLDRFRDEAKLARALGAECIGMWPGGPLRGQTIQQAIRRLAQSFRQAADIAADLELIPAFEIEPPFVFNTEEHMKAILDQANHPKLKVIYDPSHFDLMNGSTGRPHEMLQRIGVQNIGYVHLTDSDGTLRDGGTSKHLPCGDGHIDIARSLAVLRDGGFRGWVMIDAWEIPDVYDACVKGKRAIERALATRAP